MPDDTTSGIKVTIRRRERNNRAVRIVEHTTDHTHRLLVAATN